MGTHASAGANYNPGTSESPSAIQPFVVTYPMTLRNNLRTLEIKSNLDAFGSAPILLALQMALYGSNTVAMWKKQYISRRIEFRPLHLK
jgi:hypothetical protein